MTLKHHTGGLFCFQVPENPSNRNAPLQIEKRLVDSFLESMENNTIEFERHEKEFVEHLYYLVMHDKFISRAVYDTFFALIEEKSYVERTS